MTANWRPVGGQVSDPAPGNPDQIDSLANYLRGQANGFIHNADAVRKLATNRETLGMKGKYTADVNQGLNELPGALRNLGLAYRHTGQALNTYALWLRRAQTKANQALRKVTSDKDAAEKLADDAAKMRETAEGKCEKRIEKALENNGIKNKSTFAKLKDKLADAAKWLSKWENIVKVATVIAAVVGLIAAIIGSGGLALIALAAGLVVLANELKKWNDGEGDLLGTTLALIGVIPGVGAVGRVAGSLGKLALASRAAKSVGALGKAARGSGHVLNAVGKGARGLNKPFEALGNATTRGMQVVGRNLGISRGIANSLGSTKLGIRLDDAIGRDLQRASKIGRGLGLHKLGSKIRLDATKRRLDLDGLGGDIGASVPSRGGVARVPGAGDWGPMADWGPIAGARRLKDLGAGVKNRLIAAHDRALPKHAAKGLHDSASRTLDSLADMDLTAKAAVQSAERAVRRANVLNSDARRTITNIGRELNPTLRGYEALRGITKEVAVLGPDFWNDPKSFFARNDRLPGLPSPPKGGVWGD